MYATQLPEQGEIPHYCTSQRRKSRGTCVAPSLAIATFGSGHQINYFKLPGSGPPQQRGAIESTYTGGARQIRLAATQLIFR